MVSSLTNGDVIRRLSDDKLAELLLGLQSDAMRHIYAMLGRNAEELNFEDTTQEMLDWLGQEADV